MSVRQFLLLALPVAAGFSLVSRPVPAADPLPKPRAVGQKTGLMPRKILFGNPDKAAPQISPDGKSLAYLAPVKGVLNIWVAPVGDLAAAKPVSNDTKRGIRNYNWAFTGKHLLYIQDAGGDENFHVYRIDLTSGETKDLTPLEKVRANIEAVSHRFPEEILVGLNDRDPRFHSIYRVNIVTGDRTLVQENSEYEGFVIDEDFQVRLASKMTPDGGRAVYQPDAAGAWKEFIKVGQEDSLTTNAVGFDKTGDVLYLIDSRNRDTGAFRSHNLKTGEQKLVAEDRRADCGGVMVHPTEQTIQAVSFTYDRTRWKFLDPKVEADFAKIKQKLGDADV
ncbi:MAG: S9 family peptidase, partial [Planctomycetaceae bacterium]